MLKNIQLHQTLNLLILFLLGKFFLGLQISYSFVFWLFVVGVVTEQIFVYFRGEKYLSFSGINSTFGVIFMIKSATFFVLAVSLFLGLLQKNIVKALPKKYKITSHIFNPSNFSVSVAYLLFSDLIYINTTQWSHNLWVSFLLLCMMIFILFRTKQFILVFVFMVFMYVLSNFFITTSPYQHILFFTSNSFILFSGFMMSDPKTTPKNLISMLLFAYSVSFIYVLLFTFLGNHEFNIFFALTLTNFCYAIKFFIKDVWLWKKVVFLVLVVGSVTLYFSSYSIINQKMVTVQENMGILNAI